MELSKPFKTCPTCFETWSTRDGFISDVHLELNGYQADLDELDQGLFYFTHYKPNCGTTMTIEVRDFKSLYSGEICSERKTDSKECPRYCFNKEQLDKCDVSCECAFVREIIQIIKNRKAL